MGLEPKRQNASMARIGLKPLSKSHLLRTQTSTEEPPIARLNEVLHPGTPAEPHFLKRNAARSAVLATRVPTMATIDLIDDLYRLLTLEHASAALVIPTAAAQSLRAARSDIATTLQLLRSTDNIDLLLAAERSILEYDLDRYANSPGMTQSLETALAEHAVAVRQVEWGSRPPWPTPRSVRPHSLPRNRIGDVPRDEARQFFRSHTTPASQPRHGTPRAS